MLKSIEKQKQRLAYRAVLRELIGRNDFTIHYDQYRKPHLKGFDGQISVSHSGSLAAAMVNTVGPAGIDVERVSPRILPLGKRFLSPIEWEEAGQDDMLKMTLYWSAKEALFKLEGKRLLSFSHDIYIHPFNTREQGLLTGEIKRGHAPGKYEMAWEVIQDYVLVYTL